MAGAREDRNLGPVRKLRDRLRRCCAAYFDDAKELAVEVLAALRLEESRRFARRLEAIDVIRQELGPSYLMNIKDKLGALRDEPLIEIQIGPTPWWNTRLYLVAALGQDLGGAREFVFVDQNRGFLNMALPAEIRHRLQLRWPGLERAYAAFRNEAPTFSAMEGMIWRYPQAVWDTFGLEEKVAKEDVTRTDLEYGLGIHRDAEAVQAEGYRQASELQNAILQRTTQYGAVIRDGRVEGLVEYVELARKRALAQFA
jgi:hypothetical protein